MNLNTYKRINNSQKSSILDKITKMIIPRLDDEPGIQCASDTEKEMVDTIMDAKREWENACANFEYASEQEVVDYYTYKIKACQVRYDYYIKKAKELGIKLEGMEVKV